MFGRALAFLHSFVDVSYAEGTAFCMRCADVYDESISGRHVCPPFVITGTCEDCGTNRRLDATREHRCLTCGSLATRAQKYSVLNQEMN